MAKERPNGKDGSKKSNTWPWFYVIAWPPNLMIHVSIPHNFRRLLKMNEQGDEAILWGPLGSWTVKLEQYKGDLLFAGGWQEFTRQHTLGNQEWLLFKYNGNMAFDVVIYDRTGFVRKYQADRTVPSELQAPFASTLPFFHCCVQQGNVGKGGVLVIPKEFSRAYLPLHEKIILRNSEGICWSVILSPTSNKHHLSFDKGWKEFADSNSLEIGDNCVFELVKQDTMKVYNFK